MNDFKILDVGCGHSKKGTIGIDYSKNSDADILADAHYLPFQDCSFDKVLSVTVLEHSPNPLVFLKEQYRVLKQKGMIELATDNAPFYAWSVLKTSLIHEDIHKDHYMIFFPRNVLRLMKLAGFEVTSFKYLSQRSRKFRDKLGLLCAKILVRVGLWRSDCLFWRFRVKGQKIIA